MAMEMWAHVPWPSLCITCDVEVQLLLSKFPACRAQGRLWLHLTGVQSVGLQWMPVALRTLPKEGDTLALSPLGLL